MPHSLALKSCHCCTCTGDKGEDHKDHNVQYTSTTKGKIFKQIKSNVTYDEHIKPAIAKRAKRKRAPPADLQTNRPIQVSPDLDWLAPHARPADHAQAVDNLRSTNHGLHQRNVKSRQGLREHRTAFADPIPINKTSQGQAWPMDSTEEPPFPPPWPSASEREAMMRESASTHPETPLGPLAQKWVNDLERWYQRLQVHFQFDPSDLPKNLRRHVHKWKYRLSYLKKSQPLLFQEIIRNIEVGHKIPFDRIPRKYFRTRNPPSLAADKQRAWSAIKKDIAHGAIEPVDLAQGGVPHCVCPVRTAEKSDGSARFVHNSRKVNKCVPPEGTKCKLESLLRTRNMLIPGGFLVGSDFASGYHCISMHEEHKKYVAFALHISELPAAAIEWLKKNFPESYLEHKQCFVFRYAALPFGLSSSCKTFNDLISALMGFWRRCSVDGTPTRVSSYIDDLMSVTAAFDMVSVTPS